jgi:hypothetical protein
MLSLLFTMVKVLIRNGAKHLAKEVSLEKLPVVDDLTLCNGVLQAPGYSTIIKRPMDLKTMKALFESGHYQSWDALQEDVETMFNNAMAFNRPETQFFKQV